MASVEYMEEQSPGHSGLQPAHPARLATFSLSESPAATVNVLAPSPLLGQQFTAVRQTAPGQEAGERESSGLAPALPSLVHLPLCRQSAAVVGLRYRNLGKSGLRVSNVGLGMRLDYHLNWPEGPAVPHPSHATPPVTLVTAAISRRRGQRGRPERPTLNDSPCWLAGTWVTFGAPISDEVAEEIVVMAFESGINMFDLSDGYCGPRAELSLGRILKQRRWRRSSYVVVTKVYWSYRYAAPLTSRARSIERSTAQHLNAQCQLVLFLFFFYKFIARLNSAIRRDLVRHATK